MVCNCCTGKSGCQLFGEILKRIIYAIFFVFLVLTTLNLGFTLWNHDNGFYGTFKADCWANHCEDYHGDKNCPQHVDPNFKVEVAIPPTVLVGGYGSFVVLCMATLLTFVSLCGGSNCFLSFLHIITSITGLVFTMMAVISAIVALVAINADTWLFNTEKDTLTYCYFGNEQEDQMNRTIVGLVAFCIALGAMLFYFAMACYRAGRGGGGKNQCCDDCKKQQTSTISVNGYQPLQEIPVIPQQQQQQQQYYHHANYVASAPSPFGSPHAQQAYTTSMPVPQSPIARIMPSK